MADGELFSTGNHPVETLLPLLHLDSMGFEADIATVSGNSVKLEKWAFPQEDGAIKSIFHKYQSKLKHPYNLTELWGEGFDAKTPYIGVFVPGGHGALNDIPFDATVGKVLRWADANDRYFISLCHGPVAMYAAALGQPKGNKSIYDGYKITLFPDSLDNGANIDIGYIPGKMKWVVGDRLKEIGINVVNSGITGEVLQDRYVLTGDSPLASNNLGKLCAKVLLPDVAKRSEP